MIKRLPKKTYYILFLTVYLAQIPKTDVFAQYNSCSVNIAAGGPVTGDGVPHCFNLNVTGFPNALPPYGTNGQCCLEGIGVSISSQCSGDLVISATSPSGTMVILSDHHGGSSANAFCSPGTGGCAGGGTSFSSYGTGSLTGASPYITCAPGQGPYFVPDGPAVNGTNAFVGEDINGLWTFCITVDNPSGCGGVNNTVNVSSVGVFGNSNSFLTVQSVVISVTNPVICAGSTTSLTAASPGAITYTWAPSNGLNTTTGALVNADPAITTTYTVTATNSSGSSSTSSVTILVANPPVVNTISYDATCGDTNGIVTAIPSGNSGPYTFSWNSIPPQMNQSANGLPPGSYTCTVIDANGCSSTGSALVGAIPGGTASVGSVINPDCNGSATGSATAILTGGTPPYNYNWNTTPLQTNPVAVNLSSGNYTVNITDANGCTALAAVLISQPPVMNLASFTIDTYCNNPTGMCNISASGGNGNFIYLWGTVPVQTNAVATGLGAGTYTCTVTDGGGCSATVNGTVNYFNPASVVVSSISAPTCYSNADGSATSSVTGGAPPYSYVWNTSPQQSTSTATQLTSGTYIVTVTDAAGCSSTASAVLGSPAPITAQLNTVNSGCTMPTGQASVSASGGLPPYIYTWNTVPVQTLAMATGLSPAMYQCTITDANLCSVITNAQINSNSSGAVSATVISPVHCFGMANGEVLANMNGGAPPYTYAWNTNPVQTDAHLYNLAKGTYQVVVTDAEGCSASDSVTVNEPPVMVTTTNSTHNYCGKITALATVNVSGGVPPYQFLWNTQPVQTNYTATALTAGSYTCIVTDNNYCQVSNSFTITDLSSGTATISTSTPVSCFGMKNGILSVTINGGSPPFLYLWNTQPPQYNNQATLLGAGNYQVLVSDANGCSFTAQATLGQPLPLVISQNTIPVVCSSKNGQAKLVVSGGTIPYTYKWNTIPEQTSETATGLAAGIYNCNITDAHQCNTTELVIVSGTQKPTAAFSYSPTVVSLQVPQCSFQDASIHAAAWLWEFNDAGKPDVSTLKNPFHIFRDTGLFCVQLTVQSPDGCMDSTEQCIQVNKGFSVFIPTAFSPNGDGLNDTFFPQMYGVSTLNYVFTIFNRWGERVFETKTPEEAWDGKWKGEKGKNTSENFIWKLQLRDIEVGEIHQYRGQVLVVK